MGWPDGASRPGVCLVARRSFTAGRVIAFLDGYPVLAEPIALPGHGARRLRTAPNMGGATTNEGRCEKRPAEVLGAYGLC
jgi:hypothetical protein